MKTQVQLGSKAPSFMKRALLGFSGAKYALVLFLLMFASVCAQTGTDYSTMTGGIESEISSAKTILIGIGTAILGVSVVFVVYKFIRKLLG